MQTTKKIDFSIADRAPLKPAPINADWIIEGAPAARNAILSRGEDGSAFTLIWDCAAGLFEWRYGIDETVYILEGSVVVQDETGGTRRLETRATASFPSDSRSVASGILCAKGWIAQARRRRNRHIRRRQLTPEIIPQAADRSLRLTQGST